MCEKFTIMENTSGRAFNFCGEELRNQEQYATNDDIKPAHTLCSICGDKASGKHYGVPACHGCRSFFRRAVKCNKKYRCVLGGDCTVSAKERRYCKACRYNKSLRVGMRKEDVMKHENLKSRAKPVRPKEEAPSLSMEPQLPSLTKPEVAPTIPILPATGLLWMLHQAESHITPHFAPYFPKTDLKPISSPQDIVDGITIELRYMVEWAKQLQVFNSLETQSQISLLRMHSTEAMFLEILRRSMDVPEEEGYFVGANGFKMVKNGPHESEVGPRIYNELLTPCKKLRVTDEELLCLKALVMFNPYTTGVTDKDRGAIEVFQSQVRMALETVAEGMENGRLFRVLGILPGLASIAEQMRGVMRRRKVMSLATTYKLLDQLVLNDEG